MTIADQAAEWAVMVDYSEMTPAARMELDTWLAADRRHRGAFLRARAALYSAEDAVMGARPMPVLPDISGAVSDIDAQGAHEAPDSGSLRRSIFRWGRGAFAGGAVLAASVAALFVFGVPILSSFNDTQRASAEQIVALRDGSVATLSQDAKIEVTLTDDYRRITLVSGEATFKVAHDKARPFVVRSGDIFAQATGTVYSVNRVDETGGTVKVTEGSVLVWARDERDHAVQLHAGGELTLKPGPRLPDLELGATIPPRLPPPELAQMSFDNETIKSAIVRFNRVNSTKIVVADPKIGDTEIVGLFHANDPERFAQAAAALTGGRIEYHEGQIVIKLK